MSDRVRVAVIGMGGFAASHHRSIHQLELGGECELVCTCDPDPAAHRDLTRELAFDARGVAVYDDYARMLDDVHGRVDVVTVPAPLPLHAEMHKACVEHGTAVYLEKPPTLDYGELQGMLEAERRANKLTNVGFNFIIEAPRQALKQRLLDGEFGAIHQAGYWGLSPRSDAYFGRTFWAGRLLLPGHLVLDSCMGNAMAHYVHDVLFWAGKNDLYSWAHVREVQAELYRAHSIESMDTVFVAGVTDEGVELRFAMSHACADDGQAEWVECDRATIYYDTSSGYRIVWRNGQTEEGTADRGANLTSNLRAYFDYFTGEAARPMTALAESEPFVALCGLTFIAGHRIHALGERFITRLPAPDGGQYVAINGLGDVIRRFCSQGLFPSEQGVGWAAPGGRAVADDIASLAPAVRRLAS